MLYIKIKYRDLRTEDLCYNCATLLSLQTSFKYVTIVLQLL